MSTFTPKKSDIERSWHLVDADGLILGRMASEIAKLLRGKHKPTFAPHIDMGDHVVIINAEKVILSSDKASKKIVYRHSGFPGGIRSRSYADMLQENPADAIRQTIRGMLPKNRLGRQQLKKLQVYAGAEHPHGAQKPELLELDQAKSRES
ncbi:MAG: 50S ribosomal protein L13 [Actinomycetota bacterium]|nr:50S ribosomal protein L13 [Actinomycetota bacterium]